MASLHSDDWLGYGFLGPFYSPNPAESAEPYFNKIPGTMKPYYDPFINAGRRGLSGFESQTNRLLNPGNFINEIGSGYQKSPGFDFAMQQALQGAGHAAAAGGMAGSPQHEQQNMQLATNLANQDYNQWLQNALSMYGMGYGGEKELMNQGYGASNELAQSLANNLATQGSLAFQGQAQRNKNIGDMFSAGAGALAAFL